jgi:hypothetical protein
MSTLEWNPGASEREADAATERSALGLVQGRQGALPFAAAAMAQLGRLRAEDLKVPGSIPGLGTACVHLGAVPKSVFLAGLR